MTMVLSLRVKLASFAKELSIRMIRGWAYYPQTQGTVEVANCTFKKRLGTLQAQKGQSNWAALLPELALVINTTTSRALPHHKIPFEVWFGRKPHWITARPMEDADEVDIYDETDAESDDDGDLVLTEIDARVVATNARLHAQLI